MKRFALGLTVGLLLFAVTAYAGGREYPEGVDVWIVDGKVFVRSVEPDGPDHFWWWCEGECGESCDPVIESVPAGVPPTDQPVPSVTPEPTATSVPVPTDAPVATEKPACNRGLGNGSEGCDPGNSGGKPGSAGEDDE